MSSVIFRNDKIILTNVRLSFPSLYKKTKFRDGAPQFEATFLFPKEDKKEFQKLLKKVEDMQKEANATVKKSNLCIKDGDESGYDGYEGHWSIKASSKKLKPSTLTRRKEEAYEEDDLFYPGCYVDAQIDFWFQSNEWGKRINANLYGVRFVKDGDEFGGKKVSKESIVDAFDDLEDDEEGLLGD